MQTIPTRPLSRRTLLCYSAGSLVETTLYGFCGLYLLNFYTDVAHLDPRLIGYAFSIRFLVDAFSDPMIGFLSDRTQSRFGRRRPYFWGVIPAAISFYLLLTPPAGSQLTTFVYLTVVLTVLIASLTIFGIPYLALSWELTSDYNDRTRISGYRRFMEVIAEVIATLAIPLTLAVSAAYATEGVAELSDATMYPVVAIVLSCIMVGAAAITFFGTEGTQTTPQKKQEGFISGVKAAYRNRPFVILLITFTLVAVADRVATALLFYLLEHLHGVSKEDSVPLFLTFFGGSLASPFVWILLSKRCGKKTAYIIAMVFWGTAFTLFAAYPWEAMALHGVVFLMGAANSGVLIVPGAIIPDVIEWEQLRNGQRREGVYAGLAKFSWKISTGACFILVGHLLSAVGYDGAKVPTESVLNGLRLVFVVLPGLLLATAIVAFRKFPITAAAHSETLRQLE